MDKYEGYKIILKEVLSEKRYAHSLSVADTAAKLAIINDADAEKAYLAGLMHDYAKDIPEDKLCKAPNVNEEACADFLKGEFLLEGKPCYVLDSEKVIKLSDREKVANTERKDK